MTLVPTIGVQRPLPRGPGRETLDETRPEEERHVGTGVRRTRFACLERGARPDGAGARGRDRAGGRHHDLRHRPAHPQGGRARGRPGPGARPRGRRHRRRGRGRGARDSEVGDRVLVSCITSCGRCRYCREGRYGQCRGGGGWILGHLIDGTQAEYVRIPFADLSAARAARARSATRRRCCSPTSCPPPTRSACSTAASSPADTVVIVGAGPIGLAAVLTARLFSPTHVVVVDPVGTRRDAAQADGRRRAPSAPTTTCSPRCGT